MKSNRSRFEVHSRRSLLVRSAVVSAFVVLPACGSSDEDAFSSAATATSASTVADATASGSTGTDAVGDTTPGTDAPVVPGASWPSGAEMVVDFTFSATGGGPTRNPYVAVWVEDAEGNLVKTVALWVEQSSKAQKYIHEMRRWYDVAGGDLTMSSATRIAGDYSVVWDGTNDAGELVAAGEYVVYIEAAREHGPYEIIGQPVTIADEAFELDLEDEGELSAVALRYVV